MRHSQGFFSLASTCPACKGEGHLIEHPCKDCGGLGTQKKRQKIVVTIPPGVENGKRVVIKQQGDTGLNGGPPGDLFVFIRVKPHEYFERQDFNLYCAVPVSITQAALGAEIQVTTLDGKAKVKIPPGTQNGAMIPIKNEGVPSSGGKRGILYIKVILRIPTKLSKRGKELLEDLAKVEGEESSPKPIPLTELASQ